MKLSNIAILVVAALGVVAVGGSWYTGKQVEEKYQQLIEKANGQFKQLEGQYGNIEIKDVQLDRHFFSSDAKYRIEVEANNGEKMVFVGNDKIHHGPLPLNRLAKFNLVPVMMSMENQIRTPEQLKALMGEQFGSGTANMGYSGNVDGDFTLSPIKFTQEKGEMESSPIKMAYRYSLDRNNLDAGVDFDRFSLKSPEIDVNLQGVSYEIQKADAQGYANLGLGEVKIKIKNVEVINNINKDLTQWKDFDLQGENLLKGDRVVSAATIATSSFKIAGMELGKWKMDMTTDFDAKLAEAFGAEMSRPQVDNTVIGEQMLQLFGKSSKIHLNDLSFDNGSGKLDFSLILNVAQFDLKNLNDTEDFFQAFSQSKLAFKVNRGYLEEVIRQAKMVKEHLNEAQAKTQAAQEVQKMLANIGHTDYVVVKDDNIQSELLLDDGKLMLNGRPLSKDEIETALFVIMLGASGFGR